MQVRPRKTPKLNFAAISLQELVKWKNEGELCLEITKEKKTSYTKKDIEIAVIKVKNHGFTIRKASKMYNIPLGTLHKKVKLGDQVPKKHGGQTRLDSKIENLFVQTIIHMTDWRVPFDSLDIRLLVKSYCDKVKINDARFKNNMPRVDWVQSFIKRHCLTNRVADNVKHSRAVVNEETVNKYFDNLYLDLKDIPRENIYNYDETNITDNPGSKSVIVRRGHGNRVDKKQKYSKQSTSLMFSGNAIGEFLPPMVVYKAKNLYQGWTQGGPPGTVYDITPNGWFDSRTFTRWFMEIYLPVAISKAGTTLLIGDNLGFLFSPEVIEATIQHNIKFITMPSNATHLCQPLDVAVFRGLKQSWRSILLKWRLESRIEGAIPKEHQPTLLNKLNNTLRPEALISGFRATGIYPMDKTEVIKRL
ncbi:uncharacterized protein LOC136082729 [Hydra vulgaris]|uniref:Uncharacterized protein LOC136082729 n=1 Tax=Hydra vulgaris TaxID=6087 RepID=A0ABM4C9B7_HYDVU